MQGTGAEWALWWIADLRKRLWRLREAGPLVTRRGRRAHPAALADTVAGEAREAAATASGMLFRGLAMDFPLNISIVRSYADAGKPGATVQSDRARRRP